MKNKIPQKIGSRAIAAGFALAGLASSLEAALQKVDINVPETFSIIDEVEVTKRVPVPSAETRHMPFLYHDNEVTIVAYSHHADGKPRHPQDGLLISTDGGQTWPTYHFETDFNIVAITRLPNGHLFFLNTMTLRMPDDVTGVIPAAGAAKTASCVFWTSPDNGQTLVRHEGTVHMPDGKFQRQLAGDDPTTVDEMDPRNAALPNYAIALDANADLPACAGSPPNSRCTCLDTPIGDNNTWGAFVFHRSVFVIGGDLYATMYGRFHDDNAANTDMARVIWVKSINDGADWTYVSTVAQDIDPATYHGPVAHPGFAEPVVARCADGSLLAVMRTKNYEPMYQCRSVDNGLNWSLPVLLPGVTPEEAESVDPDLALMANGTLVLTYGRTNMRMLVSLDGNGEEWQQITEFGNTNGSEYTGVREVAHDTLMLVTDAGTVVTEAGSHTDDKVSPPAAFTHKHRNKIVEKRIGVSRFEDYQETSANSLPANYILAGAGAGVSMSGGYSVSGYGGNRCLYINDTDDSVYANAVHVVAGDTATAGAKTFECMVRPVDAPFGNIISFNQGGTGNAESLYHLRIKSNGGLAWYDAAGWHTLAGGGTMGMGEWNKLRVSMPDKNGASVYVDDVFVGVAGPWNAGAGEVDRVRFCSGSTSGVGDRYYVDNVVVYAGAVRDFQSTAIDSLPEGWALVGGIASVAAKDPFPGFIGTGNKALRIQDQSTTVRSTVVHEDISAATAKELRFSVFPATGTHPISFSLNGGASTDAASVHWFSIDADGGIRRVDGTSSTQIAPAGTVDSLKWSEIRLVVASTGGVDVFVDKGYVGNVIVSSAANKPIDRVRFMSSSKSGMGDDYYVDNVVWGG